MAEVDPNDSVQPKPNESVQPDENAKVEEVHKKRKEMKVRSKVWDHFLKIFDENGNLVKARCVHCKNVWAAEPRKHGTNNLKTHMGTCSLNRGLVIASGQTQFQFQLKGESVVGQPTTWKFDHVKSRQSLARMIVKDEQPFSMVENEGFQDFVRTSLPPTFGIPSRRTVTRDCLELYNETKSNMMSMFKETKQRFSITTDTWTSNQRMSYMCITTHWINEQWEIKKTVLSFSPVDSHKGVDIGEAIEKCLLEWGVDKLFCVTVDNASANDNVIKSLKSVLRNWGTSILDGEHLHMRCVAHILNLVVQDGLREISDSHNAVRAAVKYVKQSPARLKKFKECAEREKIESNKTLCGDVPTRWNSTYMMLDVAEKYEKAFERYERQDPQFAKDLNSQSTRVPNGNDWKTVRKMIKFLKFFYDMAVRVSGCLYVTANSFLTEISAIDSILHEWKCSNDIELSLMVNRMLKKFEKYWGQPEEMNKVVFIAVILDPTKKLDFLRFVLTEMHGETRGQILENMVKEETCKLFNVYKNGNRSSQTPKQNISESESLRSPSAETDSGQQGINALMSRFKRFKSESGSAIEKTELDKYLGEDIEDVPDLDILQWWKLNGPRFPVLAQMARDVLAVPITSFALTSNQDSYF